MLNFCILWDWCQFFLSCCLLHYCDNVFVLLLNFEFPGYWREVVGDVEVWISEASTGRYCVATSTVSNCCCNRAEPPSPRTRFGLRSLHSFDDLPWLSPWVSPLLIDFYQQVFEMIFERRRMNKSLYVSYCVLVLREFK